MDYVHKSCLHLRLIFTAFLKLHQTETIFPHFCERFLRTVVFRTPVGDFFSSNNLRRLGATIWQNTFMRFLQRSKSFVLNKVVIKWSRLDGVKFCPVLPGSRQCYKLFIHYILLQLHVKSFIPTRWNPSLVLRGGSKFSHVITSVRLSGMKKLFNKSV